MGFPGGSACKESACNVGDLGSVPGSGRFYGEGNDNPLQYPCLENPMDIGAWWVQSMGSQRVRHDWETNTSLQEDIYITQEPMNYKLQLNVSC